MWWYTSLSINDLETILYASQACLQKNQDIESHNERLSHFETYYVSAYVVDYEENIDNKEDFVDDVDCSYRL